MENFVDKTKKLIDGDDEEAEKYLINYFSELDAKDSKDEELLKMKSCDGKTLIDLAISNVMTAFLCLVVEKYKNRAREKNIRGETFLHDAAWEGFSDVLIKALEVDPELAREKDEDDRTFLHIAARQGLFEVLIKALEVDPELAKEKNWNGETILHTAAEEGLSEVLIKALEINPDLLTIKTKEEQTVLDIARTRASKKDCIADFSQFFKLAEEKLFSENVNDTSNETKAPNLCRGIK